MLVGLVRHPTREGGEVVAAWAWGQLREQQTSLLTTALAIVLWTSLAPDGMEWGKKSEAGAIMLTHLLVASAVADLRTAMQ
eukprot:3405941-Heterocapsa_arctica.AAC.1